MPVKNIVKSVTLGSLASSGISSTYTAVITLSNACFMIRIINNSDEDVTVSYDGTHDADFIPEMSSAQIQAQTNAQPTNSVANFAQGTTIYVKGTSGTGSVYVAGYYQPTGTA